jgi:phage terminase large subunit-like protein
MKVGELFDYYSADLVVAEKNNGGDMVSTTLQLYNKNLPIKLVSATRGKLLRAEPISLHFSNGKIHLVGDFPDLEKQMVEYDGKGKSPDNLDSFVWACTELTLNKRTGIVKSQEFYL